jgi:hypothetical protein
LYPWEGGRRETGKEREREREREREKENKLVSLFKREKWFAAVVWSFTDVCFHYSLDKKS